MVTNGNDGAFARAGSSLSTGDYDLGATGLTIREYFAAMAMQGLMAHFISDAYDARFGDLAYDAVKAADALIDELNKEANHGN